jgi:hypothetical protein
MYTKKLKRSGVTVRIRNTGGVVTVTTDKMDILKKRKETFVQDGRIVMKVGVPAYSEAIEKLDQFLSGVPKEVPSGDKSSSDRKGDKPRRVEKPDSPEETGSPDRER